tara:strand:+ start:9571 stop:10320 length:750 start_codon:yes stop_codon:yes gene_type:complete
MLEEFVREIGIYQLIIAFFIVFIASTAQSVFGMGWGMIAAPLLALLNPSLIPGTIVFLGFFAALYPSIKYYKDVDWYIFKPAIIGRIVGSIIAGWITAYIVASGKIEIVLGCVLLVSIFISVFSIKKIKQNARNHFIAGGISGVLGTIVGVGGTPMGIIYQNENPVMVRANNNLFFTIGSISSVFILLLAGVMKSYHIIYGFLLLPPLFTASFTAKYFIKYGNRILKPYILSICTISSIILMLRGLEVL